MFDSKENVSLKKHFIKSGKIQRKTLRNLYSLVYKLVEALCNPEHACDCSEGFIKELKDKVKIQDISYMQIAVPKLQAWSFRKYQEQISSVQVRELSNYIQKLKKVKEKKKSLILPQLSAGGVAAPELQKRSEEFPFRVIFGPVWSKDLPEFITNRPARKPDKMKLAKFTLKHRFRGFITHTTFLLRKIFALPLIVLFLISLVLNLTGLFDKFWWAGELLFWIIFLHTN